MARVSRGLARHVRELVTLAPGPARWRPATKAALTGLLCLAVPLALGRLDLGLLCITGTFAVLYAPEAALRRRVATVGTIGAALVAATALGALTAGSPVVFAVLSVALAMVSAGVCLALRVGPPGSYFLVLCAGIAHYLAREHGTPPGLIAGMTAVGVAVALAVTLVELALEPRRPERRAIEAAERAVDAYSASSPGRAGRSLHRVASQALATAEEAVAEGMWTPDRVLTERLAAARRRYRARLRHAATLSMGGHGAAWDPRNPDAHRWLDDDGVDAIALPDADSARRVETALEEDGRRTIASWRRRLATGLRYPGEPWSVALGVGLATAASILVLYALVRDVQTHLYWVIAFSALVLHQGGPRVARTYRAVHRLLGTLVGLGLFLLLALAEPAGWWMVAVVVSLQFAIELLVARNYGLAVTLITPLALIVSTGGRFDGEPWGLVGERLLDTVVGVTVALVVVWTVGRRAPHRAVRGDLRRVRRETTEFRAGREQHPDEVTLAGALRDLHGSSALLAADGHRDSPEYREADEALHEGFLLLAGPGRSQADPPRSDPPT